MDNAGRDLAGFRGYKYFGRARDLPGVKEMLAAQERSNLTSVSANAPRATEGSQAEPGLGSATRLRQLEQLELRDADAYYGLHEDDGPEGKLLGQLEAEWERVAMAALDNSMEGNGSGAASNVEDAWQQERLENALLTTPTVIPSLETMKGLLERKRAAMPSHTAS